MTIKDEINNRIEFVGMQITALTHKLEDPCEDRDFLEGKHITLMSERLFLIGLINKIEALGKELNDTKANLERAYAGLDASRQHQANKKLRSENLTLKNKLKRKGSSE